MVLFKGS